MNNEEILMRIKKHYFFLNLWKGKVDQKIIDECKKNMELVF